MHHGTAANKQKRMCNVLLPVRCRTAAEAQLLYGEREF